VRISGAAAAIFFAGARHRYSLVDGAQRPSWAIVTGFGFDASWSQQLQAQRQRGLHLKLFQSQTCHLLNSSLTVTVTVTVTVAGGSCNPFCP
tara:strand:+ start:15542 stop:15817 length:276 start_codon:yes stop_codon:yes gene_type:complete